MRTYLLRRLLLFIPTAFGVSIFIFAMLHTIPGDYATALILGDARDQSIATVEDFERVREKLGLTGSLPEQYGRWLWGLARGDLGISWQNRLPVVERMGDRIFMSLELGILSVALACVLGTTLGVIAAVRRDTWVDYALRSISMGFHAMPGFWVTQFRRITAHDPFFSLGSAARRFRANRLFKGTILQESASGPRPAQRFASSYNPGWL